MASVSEERVDGLSGRGCPQLVDPISRGKVRLDDGNLGSKVANAIGSRMNLRPISGDEQVEALLRTDGGEFQTDARRGAGHDCEWFAHRSPASSVSIGSHHFDHGVRGSISRLHHNLDA